MHRLFETTTERVVTELDGAWEFCTDRDDEGRAAGYAESFPTEDATDLQVPCVWNAVPEFYEYEGPAWYRRTFTLREATNVRLTFMAVCHDTTVYLDGERLGEHYGGYTPFDFHLADLAAGEHELVLRVDNTHDEETIPKPHVDWYHYGGITRPVVLEAVGDAIVDDVHLNYAVADDGSVTVEPDVEIHNFGAGGTYDLSVAIDGEVHAETSLSLEADDERVSVGTNFTLDDPDRWSPDDPTLYDYTVRLERAAAGAADADAVAETDADADDYRDRVGFREIEVTPTDILVNGEPVDIRGVNRHEDHPEWGHAVPQRLMQRDVDIIRDAGCNGVRTSHYPNHPAFLDYCDREGLLVVEEIPYWHFEDEDFEKDVVLERGKQMLAEMVTRDYDHPAIVAWSLHNECETQQQEVAEATEELAAVVRDIDTSRPVTYATNKHYLGDEENSTAPIDFLCINGYWGWYSEEREWDEFLDSIREEFPEMPIVVSEFGAGAVAGERNFDRRKWSERRQSDIVENAITTFDEKEYVAGYYIWQFCDVNADEGMLTGRPKLQNNKGIVDAYRQPKEAFWTVRDLHGVED